MVGLGLHSHLAGQAVHERDRHVADEGRRQPRSEPEQPEESFDGEGRLCTPCLSRASGRVADGIAAFAGELDECACATALLPE